jgi:hypothetical protein
VKRRTRVAGLFPNETSVATLAPEIMLRSSEEWALKRYLAMDTLQAAENPKPTTVETLTRPLRIWHSGYVSCICS